MRNHNKKKNLRKYAKIVNRLVKLLTLLKNVNKDFSPTECRIEIKIFLYESPEFFLFIALNKVPKNLILVEWHDNQRVRSRFFFIFLTRALVANQYKRIFGAFLAYGVLATMFAFYPATSPLPSSLTFSTPIDSILMLLKLCCFFLMRFSFLFLQIKVSFFGFVQLFDILGFFFLSFHHFFLFFFNLIFFLLNFLSNLLLVIELAPEFGGVVPYIFLNRNFYGPLACPRLG